MVLRDLPFSQNQRLKSPDDSTYQFLKIKQKTYEALDKLKKKPRRLDLF
jgi:hypothetical protein